MDPFWDKEVRAMNRAEDARSEANYLREMLRAVQWCVFSAEEDGGDAYVSHSCPVCGASRVNGHIPGCRLKAAIG